MLQTATGNSAAPEQGYPDDLTSDILAALAALAAVETRYQTKREALYQVSGPDTLKQRFSDHLEARHQQEREAVIQRLVELHYSLTVTARVRDPDLTH
ncbi:hypothetical protein [Microvirga aerophila]|uniref:Uncharacterized protein n=1 Tax=Microvirga aerophila TaxID=670291 RepID=A0A512C4K5_9HYPH|nr:hypothetical protein [Microvirga aerophila]GEO19131.1 hypothetical protein MAE02_68270 [Microvirga aerophila]